MFFIPNKKESDLISETLTVKKFFSAIADQPLEIINGGEICFNRPTAKI